MGAGGRRRSAGVAPSAAPAGPPGPRRAAATLGSVAVTLAAHADQLEIVTGEAKWADWDYGRGTLQALVPAASVSKS